VAGTLAATPIPAAAAGPDTIEMSGRGWGHGRGMSQYGAYGYARDHGWTFDRILRHYYGGTDYRPASQASNRPVDPNFVRVNIVASNGEQTITIGIASSSAFSVTGAPGVSIPPSHKGVQLRRNGLGWDVWSRATATTGTWTKLGTGQRIVTIGRASGTDQLQLHNSRGVTHYPGSIRAFTDGSKHRTLNITTAEEYLRGVVPREMPASWHAEALKVQAVAARSYLLAGDTRHTDAITGGYYADTCDTTMCQVYDGHLRNGTRVTHPATDAALAATAGHAMIRNDGRIARTEFSSTSGGWTAGGDFPAVQDLGDVISPVHTWQVNVSVAPLESRCGGDFLRIDVTSRNGLGADGGRVLSANVVCANRTITATGNDIRTWLGLRSDWWTPLGPQCDPAGPEVAYIDAAHHLFVDRRATDADVARWCADLKAKRLSGITNHLATSDEWAGNRITGLYHHILQRSPDPIGYQNWLEQVRQGYTLREIATGIYASSEFQKKFAPTTREYVEQLYVLVLGRAADAPGRDSWVRQIDSGQTTRRKAADGFYQSIESRKQRVTLLYQDILGRKPDPTGMDTWTRKLLTVGDIRLAATLAQSEEYYQRVT
jgi:peptidoglycan hydrolase-like amidase